MPEPNGDIPLTGDPRVDAAIERIRGKFRDVEDAMVVQAYLNRDIARLVKEEAEHLQQLREDMDSFKEQQKAEAAERKAKDAALDQRVSDVVSAIGDLIRRIPPQSLR